MDRIFAIVKTNLIRARKTNVNPEVVPGLDLLVIALQEIPSNSKAIKRLTQLPLVHIKPVVLGMDPAVNVEEFKVLRQITHLYSEF